MSVVLPMLSVLLHFFTLHVTNENVIFQSIFECFPSNNSSTNPLEIKTLTKDIHLCSFLDITLFVSVMLHIKSLMLHIKSLMLHIKSLMLHIKSVMLHIKSLMLHIKSLMLHIKSVMLHIKSLMLHIKSLMLQNVSDVTLTFVFLNFFK
jgi:hypothetical protein